LSNLIRLGCSGRAEAAPLELRRRPTSYGGTRKLVPIKQVAQEPGFYTDAVEESLTEYVEKPANAVLDKLRLGEAIGEVDRAHLAYYMGTMIRRVPHARTKA